MTDLPDKWGTRELRKWEVLRWLRQVARLEKVAVFLGRSPSTFTFSKAANVGLKGYLYD
jgi:hypothetical protein